MIPVHVRWVAAPDDVDLARLVATLAAAERADFERLRLASRRRGFLLSRALLRRALPAVTGAPAREIAFDRAASGRLRLVAPAGWHISVSHADGLAAIAVATAPCGVDIERPRAVDAGAVARRYFAAAERDRLAALPESDRQEAFFRLWTLKEAAAKALGAGLAGHLGRLAFELDGEHPRPAFATPALAAWQGAAGEARLAAVVATAAEVAWSTREEPLASLLAGDAP